MRCFFSPVAFKIFFYVFSFQNFVYNVSRCRFLGLSCLEFAQILDFVGLWILPNLRNFHHYFYEYFLSPTFFLLVFLGLWLHKCYILLCSLMGHWVSLPFGVVFLFLFFPQSIFSLSFRFCHFQCFIFKLINSFFCAVHSVIKPIHWVLYFAYCIFSSKISIWFLISSVSLLKPLIFFTCFKNA